MEKEHILIVDDIQDIFENLEYKLNRDFTGFCVSIAKHCDEAYDFIKQSKVKQPITLLILDLTFKNNQHRILKEGKSLLKELQIQGITIPTIIYTSHDELEHIHPVIKSYQPNGYVIKTHDSYDDLVFGIKKALKGERHYTFEVQQALKKRVVFEFDLDDVDSQIIALLPDCTSMQDWEGKVLKDGVPIVYKTIANRIKSLLKRFEVFNEKQLLLKLYELGFL